MPPSRHPPGTQLWVRADDGIFWPAVQCGDGDYDHDMLAFMLTDSGKVPDGCVRFYHDKESVFPIDGSDTASVRRATWREEERSDPSLAVAVGHHDQMVKQRGVQRFADMAKAAAMESSPPPLPPPPIVAAAPPPPQPPAPAVPSSAPPAADSTTVMPRPTEVVGAGAGAGIYSPTDSLLNNQLFANHFLHGDGEGDGANSAWPTYSPAASHISRGSRAEPSPAAVPPQLHSGQYHSGNQAYLQGDVGRVVDAYVNSSQFSAAPTVSAGASSMAMDGGYSTAASSMSMAAGGLHNYPQHSIVSPRPTEVHAPSGPDTVATGANASTLMAMSGAAAQPQQQQQRQQRPQTLAQAAPPAAAPLRLSGEELRKAKAYLSAMNPSDATALALALGIEADELASESNNTRSAIARTTVAGWAYSDDGDEEDHSPLRGKRKAATPAAKKAPGKRSGARAAAGMDGDAHVASIINAIKSQGYAAEVVTGAQPQPVPPATTPTAKMALAPPPKMPVKVVLKSAVGPAAAAGARSGTSYAAPSPAAPVFANPILSSLGTGGNHMPSTTLPSLGNSLAPPPGSSGSMNGSGGGMHNSVPPAMNSSHTTTTARHSPTTPMPTPSAATATPTGTARAVAAPQLTPRPTAAAAAPPSRTTSNATAASSSQQPTLSQPVIVASHPPQTRRPVFKHADPWGDDAVHHLRYSIFDVSLPHSKDSLDPSWLFHTMLGAVTIDDAANATSVEFEGIDSDLGYSYGARAGTSMGRGGRRILLVALGPDQFGCDHGWMEPVPIEEGVTMRMVVELAPASSDPDYDRGTRPDGSGYVPKNWRLPSSQQSAIKTFIPMDVTEAFQEAVKEQMAANSTSRTRGGGRGESPTLSVRLNVLVENQSYARGLQLWGGVLALIAAAPVENDQVCKWITTRPQLTVPVGRLGRPRYAGVSASAIAAGLGSGRAGNKRGRDEAASDDDEVDVDTSMGMTVSVQCPISLQLMGVPARGLQCTHQQCCELAFVVEICTATKVWACPFCKGPMPFREIIVDMPLMDYIDGTSKAYRGQNPSALFRNNRYEKCPPPSSQLSGASQHSGQLGAASSHGGGGGGSSPHGGGGLGRRLGTGLSSGGGSGGITSPTTGHVSFGLAPRTTTHVSAANNASIEVEDLDDDDD